MNSTIEQISTAILNGKDFFNGVKLPSPQKHGTFYQCKSYAEQCATKIFNQHFKDIQNQYETINQKNTDNIFSPSNCCF